jgi:SAM-dependent methyltransferase
VTIARPKPIPPAPTYREAMSTATAAQLEAAWAERVRENRAQVDRIRQVPDHDFYAPVSSLFVADPRRTGEEALEALLRLSEPDDRWLDIGAGAGRYALPLALEVAEVIAVEPSASMRNALRTGKAEHGVANLRIVAGAWPEVLDELGEAPVADVALIAHVGYDIEQIGPFLDAMEAAASRLCVAMLTDRSPASVADPFWPVVHGMERVPLPALPELAELLRARGRQTEIQRVGRAPRVFDSFDGLATFVRRQLWITDDGEKEQRFRAALARMARELDDDSWTLATPPVGAIGLLTWSPDA